MTKEAHTARAHAKLSPSGAARWLACPGSIRLAEGMPDKRSSFAAEGTAAHTLAEICLNEKCDADRFLDRVVDIEEGTLHLAAFIDDVDNVRYFEVTEEMAEAVQAYLDYIRSFDITEDDVLEIESELDLTHVADEMFGTGDGLIYLADEAHLIVADYKHGKGVAVEPKENKQLLTYAVGAIRRYHNRPLAKVTLAVIQPRAHHKDGPVREWETDPLTVIEFEDVLRQGAVATEAEDAPLVSGDHCKFCKAAAICPRLREDALKVAKAEFGPDNDIVLPVVTSMSPDEIGETLKSVSLLESWCKRFREFAEDQAHSGNTPTGWKLVRGRSRRVWKDPESARASLAMMFDLEESDLFHEPKMKTPPQIEKMVGKKNAAALGELVTKGNASLSLAPLDDPREAVKTDASAEFE